MGVSPPSFFTASRCHHYDVCDYGWCHHALMFSQHVEFRQQLGIDSTLRGWTPPEVLTKFTPGGFFGEDREGHPVWHSNMGNLDIRGQ